MNGIPTARRKNILFVCEQNKNRSVTAERLFAASPRYDVRSRGIAVDASVPLTELDLNWADLVFVMEQNQRNRLAKKFRSALAGKKIVSLDIEDVYDVMADDLVAVLRRKLAPYLLLPEI